ncbi:MAG: DUF4235 domain-containing protein [Microthrixaceae bacterium]
MLPFLTTHPGVLAASADAKTDTGQRIGWSVVSGLSGVAAAVVTKKALTAMWKRSTDRDPPTNPADPDTDWSEALGWVVAISIGGAVARVVAQRAAAEGWERAVGSPPPTRDSASKESA